MLRKMNKLTSVRCGDGRADISAIGVGNPGLKNSNHSPPVSSTQQTGDSRDTQHCTVLHSTTSSSDSLDPILW